MNNIKCRDICMACVVRSCCVKQKSARTLRGTRSVSATEGVCSPSQRPTRWTLRRFAHVEPGFQGSKCSLPPGRRICSRHVAARLAAHERQRPARHYAHRRRNGHPALPNRGGRQRALCTYPPHLTCTSRGPRRLSFRGPQNSPDAHVVKKRAICSRCSLL